MASSDYEWERDGGGLHPSDRETIITMVVSSLLAVMPTTSSDALAAACNRGRVDALGLGGPRVAAVDLDDGSVTMQRL